MKKRLLVICCCFVLIIGGIAIFFKHFKRNNEIFQFAIYPTGAYDETYHFILEQDGTLKCFFGTRDSNDIEQKDFMRSVKHSTEKVLDKNNMQTLIDLANELADSGFNEKIQIVRDSWDVVLLYNGKIIGMNWYTKNSEIFKELADEIMELSPIPVNLHSWS